MSSCRVGLRTAATGKRATNLSLSSDVLDGLGSRMVIPLRSLNAQEHSQITAALDFLFQGY